MAKISLVEKLLTLIGVTKDKGQPTEEMPSAENITPEQVIKDELLAKSELYHFVKSQRYTSVLYSLFQTAAQKKADVIDFVEAYKDTFFHQMVVDMLVDDVLSVDPLTNDIVTITSDNEDIRRVLDELQERIDIDSFIASIAEDVVSYGDYVVRVETDGEKVVALHDDMNQKNVLVVYMAGRPIFLIQRDMKEGGEKIREFDQFLHFCVGGRKVRVSTDKEVLRSFVGKAITVSEYVKLGKPLFWGKWDLLNSLYVLTVFYPVFAVNKLSTSTIIGVKVPPETPPRTAVEIARKYQELLNVSLGVDKAGRISIADVIDTIGRYKVIPIWGDEKGMMTLADPRLEESFGLDVLEELKKVLCASLGIPYQFLFGGEGGSRLEALRAFNRYVKKVASIQRAIREGLTQLALIECRLQGMYCRPEQIEVRFRNNLISVENLDKLEFLSTTVGGISDAVNTVLEVVEKLQGDMDTERLLEFLNDYLGTIGLDGAIRLKKQKEETVAKEETGFEDIDVEASEEEGIDFGDMEFEEEPEEVPVGRARRGGEEEEEI